MMANSICRGMIAALLVTATASVAYGSDRSLGSGNGSFGSTASIRSYGHDSQGSGTVRAAHPSLVLIGILGDLPALGGRPENSKARIVLSPKAKIIDVNAVAYDDAFTPRSGCAMEMGVCVIRGHR
ncbi:hypothetical protein ACQKKX_11225 [Neorhizobium sp. NPDC001467]|uniref:hypothetical protein n=1 Tax=Neorhizobium sp. NPDC001467 TaxID=3390595 RepID=UPI003CFDA21F